MIGDVVTVAFQVGIGLSVAVLGAVVALGYGHGGKR